MTVAATDPLATSIESLEGVGPARAKHLKELGLQKLGDLLEYFPRSYQIESPERGSTELVDGEIQSARGRVVAVNYIPVRPRPRFEATLEDEQSTRSSRWSGLTAAYLRTRIHPGQFDARAGKVGFFRNLPQMTNPKWEVIDEATEPIESGRLSPDLPGVSRDHQRSDRRDRRREHRGGASPQVQELFRSKLLQHAQPDRPARGVPPDPPAAPTRAMRRRRDGGSFTTN